MPLLHARAIYFPYCLQRLDDESWVILNRNYKPLGSPTREHVAYEDVPPQFRIAKISAAQVQKLSCHGAIDEEGRIWLYEDGCVPTSSEKDMAAYLKRLSVLMKLKLQGEPE